MFSTTCYGDHRTSAHVSHNFGTVLSDRTAGERADKVREAVRKAASAISVAGTIGGIEFLLFWKIDGWFGGAARVTLALSKKRINTRFPYGDFAGGIVGEAPARGRANRMLADCLHRSGGGTICKIPWAKGTACVLSPPSMDGTSTNAKKCRILYLALSLWNYNRGNADTSYYRSPSEAGRKVPWRVQALREAKSSCPTRGISANGRHPVD